MSAARENSSQRPGRRGRPGCPTFNNCLFQFHPSPAVNTTTILQSSKFFLYGGFHLNCFQLSLLTTCSLLHSERLRFNNSGYLLFILRRRKWYSLHKHFKATSDISQSLVPSKKTDQPKCRHVYNRPLPKTGSTLLPSNKECSVNYSHISKNILKKKIHWR